ncbi:MAG TPA: RNA 3'-terminal phosphate cyclase [Candidatus Tripitaka californicus]|uniref:RNA 3'-terminal phosphate cyclase n=1 Tax=Candidatus Tripitaka californicus TaxID=3367616 RepID=UPI00402758EF
MSLLRIDGSFGEGGGQVLRTSLTLSALTGIPFEIFNIRARRKSPGLRPQHLQAVTALAKICQARLDGAEVGSSTITFRPGTILHGDYRFEIGTAGSASLVLQTLFLPLSRATQPSRVEIIGGTHVPWSPCFHYLLLQWLEYLHRLGLEVAGPPPTLEMPRAGFYPRGGGSLIANIRPGGVIKPFILEDRGRLVSVRGISAVGNLPISIAERQKAQAEKRLAQFGSNSRDMALALSEIELLEMPAVGKGTMLLLMGEFENSRCCYYGLGEIGKRAEKVADEACDALFEFMQTDGVIDEHLADQLVLPLALARGTSRFITPKITTHLLTNLEVIKKFLSIGVEITNMKERGGVVSLTGRD